LYFLNTVKLTGEVFVLGQINLQYNTKLAASAAFQGKTEQATEQREVKTDLMDSKRFHY
jgi:hypothetical protein